MKRWLCIVLLLPGSPLFAKDKKLEGYVLDSTAFRRIQSYCVDTHNLPPREVRVINRFVSRESKPAGLLARLPWHRLAACQEGAPDAIVRLEFPHNPPPAPFESGDVSGVLLVFRAGSPSPIYETPEVLMSGVTENEITPHAVELLEYGALESVMRALIHDWQKLLGTLHATAY